ncbi:inositol monophosphatase 1 [Brevipalpus obovatus]|uniref:inositol monophosphatase 1 n=1 Tax=Brevipalpus obovatus TaxID=246614 RepID=UPI003D9E46E4
MDPKTLKECEEAAVELAKHAGIMMMETSGKCKNIEMKISPTDLVTETDKAVEKYIFDELRKRFPSHKFIGEESFTGKVSWTSEPTWIIDPIDGTMNFIHTFPFACISIGLTVNKDIVLGLVYSPFLDKLYVARKGNGAYCNGAPIRVSRCDKLSEALLITELGGDREQEAKKAIETNITNIIWKVHGLRAVGSAALNACMIASGHIDCYFETGLHCWDMAAGVLIIREAGGVVIDPTGSEFNLMARRILGASNEKLARELSANIVKHRDLEHD